VKSNPAHAPSENTVALRLYTSWISTFARKAALALELKGLPYEPVDALTRDFQVELKRANPRAEVPVLFDDDLVIVNSSDIVQYLEWRYPTPALYPEAIAERVAARALERLHDHLFDPICVDCSYWHWADREGAPPPPGLMDAGQRDIDATLAQLEAQLLKRPKPWPFGAPGVVECAWFANLVSVRPLGFSIDAARFPNVIGWLATRSHPVFTNDRRRTAQYIKAPPNRNVERRKLFYSGDRMEWLFSRGFHDWFQGEILAGRAVFPDAPGM
jgi:glutathione S-transferase